LPANAFNGLTTSGNIEINNNVNLTTLHENAFNGATVAGSLQLNGNSSLTSIPQTIMRRFLVGQQ
jgi:hypothetical protein